MPPLVVISLYHVIRTNKTKVENSAGYATIVAVIVQQSKENYIRALPGEATKLLSQVKAIH